MDDLDTPMLVVSQASVSKSLNPPANVTQVLMTMLQKMQDSQEASNKRNLDLLEQRRLDMEMQLEQQRTNMDFCMEQHQKDMATMHNKTVQIVINQVPFIMHNALLGLGGVINVAPLQLKAATSSQPVFMLMEGNPTPQGSGTSTHGKSTRMIIESPPHLSAQYNVDKECSFQPPNTTVASEAITMDIDDVPRPINAPAVG